MIKKLLFSNKDLRESINEIDLLIKYDYKHVIKYIDQFIFENRLCIVTHFYKEGDLDDYIKFRKHKNKKKLNPNEILEWSTHILKGLNFLHDRKIIHRDLKPK